MLDLDVRKSIYAILLGPLHQGRHFRVMFFNVWPRSDSTSVMLMSWCHDGVMMASWWCHDVIMMSSWCHDVMMMSCWCHDGVMMMSCHLLWWFGLVVTCWFHRFHQTYVTSLSS